MLSELLDALEKLAKEHTDTVMPGYTHLQRAQPVTLAYHLLAYYQMFSRDGNDSATVLKESTGSLSEAAPWQAPHTIPTEIFSLKSSDLLKSFLTVWTPWLTEISRSNS